MVAGEKIQVQSTKLLLEHYELNVGKPVVGAELVMVGGEAVILGFGV